LAGLLGDIFGGVAKVGLEALQGGLTGGLPGAFAGGAGAGLNLISNLIGNRDIETPSAIKGRKNMLANLVAAAGPRAIPLVSELQGTTDDAKIGLTYQVRLRGSRSSSNSSVLRSALTSGGVRSGERACWYRSWFASVKVLFPPGWRFFWRIFAKFGPEV
jgi:hypothetical protein